jgi:hypothetical protein
MTSFADRVLGAARLDARIYEEVEADQNALPQAMTVVAAAAVAAGIGALRSGAMGFVGTIIFAFVGWFIWAGLTWLIGTKVLPEPQTKTDFPEMLRTIGFASAPGLLGIFGIIPFIGWLIAIVVSLWQLAAMVVAVKQALDYTSLGRAIGVCLIGWLVMLVVNFFLAAMFVTGRAITGGF